MSFFGAVAVRPGGVVLADWPHELFRLAPGVSPAPKIRQ